MPTVEVRSGGEGGMSVEGIEILDLLLGSSNGAGRVENRRGERKGGREGERGTLG